MRRALPVATLIALALLAWTAAPACAALGFDRDLAFVASGSAPSLAELAGALAFVAARALQCVVSPVLACTAAAWAALGLVLPLRG